MQNKTKKILNIILNIILIFVIICTLYSIFFSCFFFATTVEGNSMQPTYNNSSEKDRILVSKLKSYSYGDIVIIQSSQIDAETGSNKYIVKRVIAIGNDYIDMKFENKKLLIYVNGSVVDESTYLGNVEYEIEPTTYFNFVALKEHYEGAVTSQGLLIPEQMIFVLGDNREDSADSSLYGPFSSSNVVGTVLTKIGKNSFAPISLLGYWLGKENV